jgi:hypothetical protein
MFALSTNLKNWADSSFSLVLEECGGNGSCLFHCIAVAASRLMGQKWSMEYVRDRIAATITPDTVQEFLALVMEDQSYQLLNGSVRFLATDSADRVQEVVSATGSGFQGTDITLRWLLKHDPVFRSVGFVLFSSFGPAYTEILNESTATQFILLFNHSNAHWQLANLVDAKNCAFSSITSETLQLLKQFTEEKKII